MSGILRLDKIGSGNTLRQGDLTVLKYKLSDSEGAKLDISGKPATVRLMKSNFTFIAYEKEGLTVASDDTISFNINKVLPGGVYYLEVVVDDKYIFPSRSDEGKFNIDKSSLGAELTIIENAGIDTVVRKAVDLINSDPSLILDEDKLVNEIIANTGIGSIEEYYRQFSDTLEEFTDLKPKALDAVTKSNEADQLSKSVQEQFNQVVIDGDSSVEAAQARVDAKGEVSDTLKDRLDKEQIEVTAQLAQTIRLDESNLSLSNFKESDRAVIQGLEAGQINAVLGYKNVKPENTNFFKTGKNLFNKTAIQVGKMISVSDGMMSNHASYSVSEYIVISPESNYAFTKIHNVAWYDSDRNFISGVSTPDISLSPKNALYMVATISNNSIDMAQIEKGDTKTPYEDFKQFIGKENTEKHVVTKEDIPIISPKMTDFITAGKNLFNKEDILPTKGIHTTTGNLITLINNSVSEVIKINQNENYAFTNVNRVAWYTRDDVFINSTIDPKVLQSPAGASIMRVSISNYLLPTAQVERGLATTEYEPYKEVIDERYLPDTKVGQSVVSGDDYEVRKAIVEKNALEFIPNVAKSLNIPTSVPSSVTRYEDVTHPNVLYFKNGWNGYKFWMAFTPYPMAVSMYENPSVVASNDNITWVEPAQNPIAPLEAGHTFQSDPEILMNGNKMELWYRATLNTAGELDTTFYRKTSTDGVNWTSREVMFKNNNKIDGEIVSQAILFEDGVYKMWFTRRGLTNIYTQEYAESSDGKTWTTRVLDIKMNHEDYHFWHGDVYKHDDGKIDMVIGCKSPTQPWAMFYTYSYDNITFAPPMLLIKPALGTSYWDNQSLYKPSLEMVGNEYYLYYSTPFRIGLTTGKSMFELGLHSKKELEKLYPVKHLRSAMNAYSINDKFDVFPDNSIIYTKIWSVEDRGWPALSGLVITQNVWKEANDTRQLFYPSGEDYFFVRKATQSGWRAWAKHEGEII